MKYLIVDGELSGTGVRDKYNDEYGYINPEELNLSNELVLAIRKWQQAYEQEHYNGYKDKVLVAALDKEGVNIAKRIARELIDVKVEYFSDAYLTTKMI